MYPVNNYLIVKEVKTEDSSPAGNTPVLYKPPTDSKVRKYEVIHGNDELEAGVLIYAKVQDTIELDDVLAIKYQDVIAKKK